MRMPAQSSRSHGRSGHAAFVHLGGDVAGNEDIPLERVMYRFGDLLVALRVLQQHEDGEMLTARPRATNSRFSQEAGSDTCNTCVVNCMVCARYGRRSRKR